jgi:hypothetical protein
MRLTEEFLAALEVPEVPASFFTTPQHNKSYKAVSRALKRKRALVVVMTAVNWWKNAPRASRATFFRAPVRWNFLRRFGKHAGLFAARPFAILFPHFVRNFFTRSQQLVHTNSFRNFFVPRERISEEIFNQTTFSSDHVQGRTRGASNAMGKGELHAADSGIV